MAEKNKLDPADILEGVANLIGLAGTAAARRVATPAKAAVEVVKSIPRVQKANEAITEAKNLEKQLDAILDKPKITKADAKKADNLANKINEKVNEAVDLGASTAKNSTVARIDKAVATKVADIKQEAGVKPAPTARVSGPDEARAAAAKQEPAQKPTPGQAAATAVAAKKGVKDPFGLNKSTGKTTEEAPVTPRVTTRIEDGAELPTTKAKTAETPPKRETSAEKLARLKTEREAKLASAAQARAAARAAAGVTVGANAADGITPPGGATIQGEGDNTVPPGGIPFGGADVGGGDAGAGDTGEGGAGGGAGGGGGGGGGGGDEGEGVDGETVTPAPAPTPVVTPPPVEEPQEDKFGTQWLILKAKLLAAGLPESTVDASVNYFRTILKDARFAGPNELENVVDQYLYLPTYQPKTGEVIDSPFYKDFGKFNEKLTTKKKPGELVGLVLGYKRTIDKYVGSETARNIFKSDDSITKYMQNDVSVAELDERANAARLRSVTADPFYVQSLKELGFIDDASDLTSFFLDPNVGTKALEDRRTAGAFATEAVRRASESTGIKLDTEFARQQAARLTNLGYSEAQITQLAGQGFENIAEQLRPTEKLSGIYERNLEMGAADAEKIQKELQAEQFLGTASQRRKRLAEQETQAFRGQSGLSTTALRSGTIGIL